MSSLFLTLLEISLTLSPLIILVLAATPFWERRYSSKLQYLLWLVLAVRLLVIWNPSPEEKPLSIPIPQTAIIGELDNPEWLQFAPEEDFPTADSTNANIEPARQGGRNTLSFLQIITFLWAGGAGIFLLYHFLAYVYMCRNIRSHCGDIENEILLGQFQSIKKELGISTNIGLFQCYSINTPLLMGFIRPRIILAPLTSPSSQTGMVLRHELAHFKRRDLWVKLLLLLVRAVYWFNPLIHIMARQANRAIELCCDADVLHLADDGQRKDYGLAILESLERKVMPASVLHSGFSDGKRQMIKRFRAIISRPPVRTGWGIICIVLVLSLAFSGLVSCMPNMPKETITSPSEGSAGNIEAFGNSAPIAANPNSVAYISPDFRENVLEKKALNPDTVGWLNVPDTSINDPILFHAETNNYYLRIGFDGQYNKNGSYFADRRSIFGTGTREELGRNTTLYGHSWEDDPDGPLFSQLKKYRNPEFARTHPYVFFSTDKENIAWEVFAVFDAHVDLPYILSEPKNMSVDELLTAIRSSSIYNYDVTVKPEDRVLTLSCCVYSVDGHPDLSDPESASEYRFAIAAKMVSPDETAKKEAKFKLNPTPAPPDTYKEI